MNPIVGRHNALLVASVAGWTLHEGGRDRVCFEKTTTVLDSVLCAADHGADWACSSKAAKSFLPYQKFQRICYRSVREVFSLVECCARLTFCSYLKHSVCHSGPLPPPPFGPQRRPPSGARLPRSIVLRRLRALIPSTQGAAILTSTRPTRVHLSVGAAQPLVPFYRLRSSCPHSEKEI